MKFKITFIGILLYALSGCASAPLSEQAFGIKLPLYENSKEEGSAHILFSSDKKYQSKEGLPLSGEPVICTLQGLKTTKSDSIINTSIIVPANSEVIVSSVIKWNNSGWEKTCWPFVSFIPELNSEYVLVNERIGGKGISALWTGVAFQSCKVSVFKINGDSFSKIKVKEVQHPLCG